MAWWTWIYSIIIWSIGITVLPYVFAFFIGEYTKDKEEREELLFNILFASLGIGFTAWFAFWKIIDSLGLYFYWPLQTSLAIVFSIAVVAGIALHRHWTAPYIPYCDDEDEEHGLFPHIFEDVLVRG